MTHGHDVDLPVELIRHEPSSEALAALLGYPSLS